jgi:DNA-binding transcriptional LysR family regulator
LRVTPAAVSQDVKALETRVSMTLFLRTTRSVAVTEAGTTPLSRPWLSGWRIASMLASVRPGLRPAPLWRHIAVVNALFVASFVAEALLERCSLSGHQFRGLLSAGLGLRASCIENDDKASEPAMNDAKVVA